MLLSSARGLCCTATQATCLSAKPQGQQPWYADLPMDVVYLWYNASDPARQELMQRYRPSATGWTSGVIPNRGELYLSLASMHAFAPWARRIFLVTTERPQLQLLAPALRDKITVVADAEFVPAELLPIFSSLVLDAFLHRIPGISNYFL